MKQNHVLLIIVIFILLVGGVFIYQNKNTQELIHDVTEQFVVSSETEPTQLPFPTSVPEDVSETHVAKDPQNATYIIEGERVTLINGTAQNGTMTVTMFGTPTVGDLTGDEISDAGVMLVVSGSGTEQLFYAAAALNNTTSYTYDGTNAIFLGENIAPQTENINNQTYIVNYAERNEGEPTSVQPSVGVSQYFIVQDNVFVETSNE